MTITCTLARFVPRPLADRRLLHRLSRSSTQTRPVGGTRRLGVAGWQRALGITGSALAGPALIFPRVVLVAAFLLGLLLVVVTLGMLAVAGTIHVLRNGSLGAATSARTMP